MTDNPLTPVDQSDGYTQPEGPTEAEFLANLPKVCGTCTKFARLYGFRGRDVAYLPTGLCRMAPPDLMTDGVNPYRRIGNGTACIHWSENEARAKETWRAGPECRYLMEQAMSAGSEV